MAIGNDENRKKWDEFSKEEKTSLLNHWFYYYGGVIVTLEEIEKFGELAKTKQEEIFNYITTSLICNNTIQTNVLVACMRQNKVDELFEHVINVQSIEDEAARAQIEEVRNYIVKEMVHSYLYPEPPVPMSVEVVAPEEDQGLDF